MKTRFVGLGIILITIIIVIIALVFLGRGAGKKNTSVAQNNETIRIVAAENFYGDVAGQLGGSHVSVTSILSDPNVAPHEYESSVQNAIAVSQAQIVIENGGGYDAWMDKLLSASPNEERIVLVGTDIAPRKIKDNPHVWYGVDNMRAIAAKITDALKQKHPAAAGTFSDNLLAFNTSLAALEQKTGSIKEKYSGTPVALTETIFLYQTQAMGLNVLTPIRFQKAIAERNDPPAADVAAASDAITKKQVNVLIYNKQTETPITTSLQNEANNAGIPVVAITETMLPGKTYQTWMLGQLVNMETALQNGGI